MQSTIYLSKKMFQDFKKYIGVYKYVYINIHDKFSVPSMGYYSLFTNEITIYHEVSVKQYFTFSVQII